MPLASACRRNGRLGLRLRIAVFFLALLASAGVSLGQVAPLPGFWISPYLLNPVPGSMTVIWELLEPAPGQVEWGLDEHYGQVAVDPAVSRLHAVTLTGLPPSQPIHYRAVSGSVASPDRVFRSPPPADQPVRVGVYGDSRTYGEVHSRVVAALMTQQPDLVVHTGDMVSDGSAHDAWRLQHFTISNLPSMAKTPWVPAWGNHDGPHPPDPSASYWVYYPPPWVDAAQPGSGYYRLPYGPVELFVLDCGLSLEPGTPQYEWLRGALRASHSRAKIAVLHFPPYSSGPHGGPAPVRELDPLWAAYGVRLVLAGHDHLYERSFRDPVNYVVTGGGGAELVPAGVNPNPYAVTSASLNHYVLLDVGAGDITVRAFDLDGNAFDSVAIPLESGNVWLSFDPEPPATAGTRVTFSASVSQPAGDEEFQFLVKGPGTGGVWAVAKEYSSANSWFWQTSDAEVGLTHVVARVRRAGSSAQYEDSGSTAYSLTPVPATGVTLAVASPSSPRAGDPVTFRAAGQGGSGRYEYKFLARGPGIAAEYTLVQDYSAADSWTLSTSGANVGLVEVVVYARAAGSSASFEAVASTGCLVNPSGAAAVSLTAAPDGPQRAGAVVTFTAAGQGGTGRYEYRFLARGPGTGGMWETVQGYSEAGSWGWQTSGADVGETEVVVYARSAGSTVFLDASASTVYRVIPLAATGATLAVSPAAAQRAGTPLTFTAAGQGGSGQFEFRFLLKGPGTGGQWRVVQEYSPSGAWAWTSSTADAGSNEALVYVRSAGSPVSPEASALLGFWLDPPVATGADLTAAPPSPQRAGAAVTFAAAGRGGSGRYEYRFLAKGPGTGGTWKVVQEYSPSGSWAWTPMDGDAGNTDVVVYVRSQGSTAPQEALASVSYTVLPTAATGAVLAALPTSPQRAGTPVTFTATAQGGSGQYEYRFRKMGPGNWGTWDVVQEYSPNASWFWATTDADAGLNRVEVYARSAGSPAPQEALSSAAYTVIPTAVSGVDLSASPSAPQRVGAAVTFSASARGGSGTYEFRFLVRGPGTGGAWRVVQDYSPSPSWVWTTTEPEVGSTEVTVYARSAGSPEPQEASAAVAYALFPTAATGVTLTAEPASPRQSGTVVTFTAAGRGGSGRYEYRFLMRGPGTGGAWKPMTDYSSSPSWDWATSEADDGLTSVVAYARSAGSTESQEALAAADYTVLPRPASAVSLSASPVAPQRVGVAVTFTAAAEGGSGVYDYRFFAKGPGNGGTWETVQGYSPSASWVWSTTEADIGQTDIAVYARSTGSSVSLDALASMGYRVNPLAASGARISGNPPERVQPGASVMFTASGEGAQGRYEYRFLIRGPATNGGWSVVQDYSESPTWTWEPSDQDIGVTEVVAYVRSAGSMAPWDAIASTAMRVEPADGGGDGGGGGGCFLGALSPKTSDPGAAPGSRNRGGAGSPAQPAGPDEFAWVPRLGRRTRRGRER